jgi:hypothetical protein
MVKFLLIDRPSAYNAILGRTALNDLKAITSTSHLKIKFPTERGVGEVRGEQGVERQCYNITMKGTPSRGNCREKGEQYQLQPGEPTEEMEEFEVGGKERRVRVGSLLSPEIKESLVAFLRSNTDVFAWCHDDMPRIDPSVILHRLNVNPNYRPIKQKRRSFATERNQAIHEEVERLLKAGFIREVDYLQWLANVVLVKKSSGK